MKATGLAAFTSKQGLGSPGASEGVDDRQRGKGEVVALTVRLSRGDWERLHQLAVAEGVSIQRLAMRGFSRVFEEKGLPGLAS